MAFPKRVHDPDAYLDYSSDWSEWLVDGDTITAADVTAEAGVTVEAVSHTETVAYAWISGGTAGEKYDVTFRVTTAAGRIDDRSITLDCKER